MAVGFSGLIGTQTLLSVYVAKRVKVQTIAETVFSQDSMLNNFAGITIQTCGRSSRVQFWFGVGAQKNLERLPTNWRQLCHVPKD